MNYPDNVRNALKEYYNIQRCAVCATNIPCHKCKFSYESINYLDNFTALAEFLIDKDNLSIEDFEE